MPSSISSISSQSSSRAGLCPHGLSPAACPVCSEGMMSGGKKNIQDKPVSKPKAPVQWSFMKCYAVGLAMRAQEKRAENIKSAFEKQIEFAEKLSKLIQNTAEKLHNTIKNIQENSPSFIQNTLQILTNIIIKPALKIVSTIPLLIQKFAQIGQKINYLIQNAGEKLAAVLGDIKNFINRKILERLKKKYKKFFSLFISFSQEENENYKNDETLAIFKSREIKKFIVKILKQDKERDNNANRSIKK